MNVEIEKQNINSGIIKDERIKAIKARERAYRKKYLSEIIEEEKPVFKDNNLILAPVGSGKSHLIEKMLIPKDYDKKIIYLTSNTALKDSLAPSDNKTRKELADKGESLGFYTSANKRNFGNVKYKVHVMTYYEFGEKVKNPNQKFTKGVELIFCDEIHSLPKYFKYDSSYNLGMAMYWLFQKQEGTKVYYFTATREAIDKLEKNNKGYLENVEIYDYLEHPEIVRYVSKLTTYISHIGQSRIYIRSAKESFIHNGDKGLAFTKLISEQEKLKEICLEEGLKPIVLWSINSKDRKMSKEQLKVRAHILNTGMIPEPYNMLIINGAMQEGWNLHDDDVTLAILDTIDITEQIQSLGRIRKDVNLVIKKTDNEDLVDLPITINKEYLNVELTAEDKNSLCDELNIIDSSGRVRRWPSVKNYIVNAGYKIEDKTITQYGKRTRVSIITKDN